MKRNYKNITRRRSRWMKNKERKKQHGGFFKTYRLADITNKFNNFKRTAKKIIRGAFS